MTYQDISTNMHRMRSSLPPAEQAEDLYKLRLEGPGTFTTGIKLDGSHEIFIVATRKLVRLLDKVTNNEERIRNLWRALPNIANNAYVQDLISNEMFNTTDMEGVKSSREEMDSALQSAESGAEHKHAETNGKHTRFVEFAKLYLGLVGKYGQAQEYPTDLQGIRSIYDQIMNDVLTEDVKPDGELFRKKSIGIYKPDGTRVHQGLPSEARIQATLTGMLHLAHDPSIPTLLQAPVAHYIFEYAHPFYDGNGRTGRFLLALHLRRELSVPTVLSLSPIIAEKKESYAKAFETTEAPYNCSEATFFCEAILSFIQEAQDLLLKDLEEKHSALKQAGDRLDGYADKEHLILRQRQLLYILIQDELFRRGPTTLGRFTLENELDVSLSTLLKLINMKDGKLVDQQGRRPIRYSLSPLARSLFLE